ncbi:MAG TPA: hypothetical protein VH482_14955 [Thermomicrobiales bacterium]
MKRRVLRATAVVAVLAMLVGAASASAGILVGQYPGRITGVEGNGNLGFKGGNMKFKINGAGRITSFKFAKIRVACTDGNVYRTSGHISPGVRAFRHNGTRKFKFHGSNSYGGVLKVVGIFRGDNHARGLLRFKGRMGTSGGVKDCTTFRQLWSAKHAR